MRIHRPTLAIVAIAALTACFPFGDYEPAKFRRPVRHEAEWSSASELEIATHNGRIEVVKGPVHRILVEGEIRATTQDRADATMLAFEILSPGLTKVSLRWPEGGRKGSEGCDLKITVPGAAGIRAHSGNGAIEVRESSAPLELESSNGRVAALDCQGAVRIKTSNGAVEVTGAVPRVYAATSNGRIAVRGALGEVDAKTSNGAIEVVLAAENPGPVKLESSNGRIQLHYGAGFGGRITGETSNGSLTADLPPGATLHHRAKSGIDAQWGSSEHRSHVRTSNGAVGIHPLGTAGN